MPRILIFIDESGNPFENEIVFSAAAAWCVIERPEGREKPFESTVDSLKQYLIDMGKINWAREIRHHELPDEYAEYLIFLAMERTKSDNSILQNEIYWKGTPLVFTTASQIPCAIKAFNPELDSQALGSYIRLSVLGNLLRPLAIYNRTNEIRIDIILDSRVWMKCINRFDPAFNKIIGNRNVIRRTHFSKSSITPGLQIADLAAGINRRYLIDSGQRTGYRLIQSHALNVIIPKGIRQHYI